MPRRTRLFEVAKQRGLSQADLARMTGLTEATISLVARGKRNPGLRFMDAVEAAFPELDPRYLFPREPERTEVPA